MLVKRLLIHLREQHVLEGLGGHGVLHAVVLLEGLRQDGVKNGSQTAGQEQVDRHDGFPTSNLAETDLEEVRECSLEVLLLGSVQDAGLEVELGLDPAQDRRGGQEDRKTTVDIRGQEDRKTTVDVEQAHFRGGKRAKSGHFF